jgi:hypothetical protein
MFRDATAHRQRARLYVVHGGRRGSRRIAQGDTKMNDYKFTQYPSNSSVASSITMLVSAWFLVAAGAILSDPASPYTTRKVMQAQTAPVVRTADATPNTARLAAIPPEAHLTITVAARRPANLRSATL